MLACFFLLIWEGEIARQQGKNLTAGEFRHLLPPSSEQSTRRTMDTMPSSGFPKRAVHLDKSEPGDFKQALSLA